MLIDKLADADPLILGLTLGETDGLTEGEALALPLPPIRNTMSSTHLVAVDGLGLAETDDDGDIDGDTEGDTLGETLGLALGETLGETD